MQADRACAHGRGSLQRPLHGVRPLDPMTLAAAGGLLLMLAAIAIWQPAREAERVDPVEALKAE